jgi:hypothetical protein
MIQLHWRYIQLNLFFMNILSEKIWNISVPNKFNLHIMND